ncbi:MAG: C39 family peptidase [Clostridiaceae bacterium]
MKKIICLLLIVLSFTNFIVFAEVDGDLTSKGGTVFIETESKSSETIAPLTVIPDYSRKLSVPLCKQINGWFCGPASVQQIIMYYNGSSPSQTTIANDLGTTERGTNMSNIPAYLNSKTGKSYGIYSIGEFSSYRTNILATIKSAKPMIIDILATTANWPYATEGHFLVINGITMANQVGTIHMVDPHFSGIGKWSSEDLKVYTVNNNHWRKQIIR